jgi:hypothetical protein
MAAHAKGTLARAWQEQPILVAITIAVVPVGIYARSVENILHKGISEYDCGGFYPRGLLFRYPMAGLHLGGISPELAPRLIAAISSLIMLPAAYKLGQRFRSRTVRLLAVALPSLPVWEVEIAQFGRMCANIISFEALNAS